MLKKKLHIYIAAAVILSAVNIHAQKTLNLQECRELAIGNNKALKIATQQERKAYYEKREALMQYFPKFAASATYLHFGDDLHLIGRRQIPQTISIPDLGLPLPLPPQIPIPQEIQDGIYKAGEIDMSNFWVMGASLTQPIFAGGRIIALNDIRSYAQELAAAMKETKMTDVIVETDEAYWQVISLNHKKKLAEAYVNLLTQMDSDTQSMMDEGVATKADRLSVSVKLNEAQITLTKAENGLSLAKMLLCQTIGLDISEDIRLYDEDLDKLELIDSDDQLPDIDSAIANRSEIRSLALAQNIYKKQEKLAVAEFLPTAGLSLGYTWMQPNLEDGLQNKFAGMWNVGVNVKLPLNFISSSAKLKAAKAETYMREYELEDTKEKIKLQINQSSYKLTEARKKLVSTQKNTETADENLRYANAGYQEGVIAASDAMAAHTAWIAAHAEMIDAQIDLKLCQLYLDKALGKSINTRTESPREL